MGCIVPEKSKRSTTESYANPLQSWWPQNLHSAINSEIISQFCSNMLNRKLVVKAIVIMAGIFVAFVATAAWKDSVRKQEKIAQYAARIKDLEANLKETGAPAGNGTLAEQATCSQQAEHLFRSLGYSTASKAPNSQYFSSHYQLSTHRCFIEIETTEWNTKQMDVLKLLLDAIGRQQLGTYFWMSRDGKKYWEVPPAQCNVIAQNGEKKDCNSEDEFAALARQYMN